MLLAVDMPGVLRAPNWSSQVYGRVSTVTRRAICEACIRFKHTLARGHTGDDWRRRSAQNSQLFLSFVRDSTIVCQFFQCENQLFTPQSAQRTDPCTICEWNSRQFGMKNLLLPRNFTSTLDLCTSSLIWWSSGPAGAQWMLLICKLRFTEVFVRWTGWLGCPQLARLNLLFHGFNFSFGSSFRLSSGVDGVSDSSTFVDLTFDVTIECNSLLTCRTVGFNCDILSDNRHS